MKKFEETDIFETQMFILDMKFVACILLHLFNKLNLEVLSSTFSTVFYPCALELIPKADLTFLRDGFYVNKIFIQPNVLCVFKKCTKWMNIGFTIRQVKANEKKKNKKSLFLQFEPNKLDLVN